ncbi:aldehyde-activating protein [Rhodobacterales bacterium HKCCE3408]|nr:aldehyde-activating protein [Rhodobacterales bacterium HKCCE3408]
MTRHSTCSCGQLTADVTGEPFAVALCSCEECQRRTGSAFGFSGYWMEENVAISGESKAWARISAVGRRLEFHFCPTCGSTIWWVAEFLPGRIGLALGNMDHAGLTPVVRVWDKRRADWLDHLDRMDVFEEGRL